jgi:hypothetical protein
VTNVLLNLPLYNAVIGALSLPNKTNKPLVLYISYGETDEWAYRFYRSYLDAAHQAYMDQRDLGLCSNDPQYKDKTALVLPTDHIMVIQ